MKNTKISRILVIVLSLVLLLGATVGIMASAEEDNAVGIKAASVIHNDKVALVFAIDVSNDAIPQDLKVEYKWGTDGEWKPAGKRAEVYNVYDDEGVEIISTHPLYATNGVAAQDYTDVVYVRAYTGETASESKMVSFSVMEFLYTKLYKDGYINNWNPEHQGKADRDLYLAMVNYAEKAQISIDKFRGEEDVTGKLITDYNLITVKEGSVGNTGKETVVDNTTVGFIPVYSGEVPTGDVIIWNVTVYNDDGTSVTSSFEDGLEIPVTGHIVCVPSIYTPSTYVKGSGYYYTATGETIEDENGDEITLPNIPGDRNGFQNSETTALGSVVADGDDKYAFVTGTTGYFNIASTAPGTDLGYKVSILEFDAKFENMPANTCGIFGLYDRVGGYRDTLYINATSGKVSVGSGYIINGSLEVNQGEWHNWRFVTAYMDKGDGTYDVVSKIYIDNVWQCDVYGDGSAANTNVDKAGYIRIHNADRKFDLSVDNIYTGYSTETLVLGDPANAQ
ncbi:MAG: hypothetical protein IJ488_01750 [Clostridia bacterium]|nr:hypothetical protein [Clostridia bacterium]